MQKVTKLIFFFISISVASQSPWTQKEGKFYTQVSFTTISNYDTLFGNPDNSLEREITDQTYQLYTEYGLTDKTTLLFNLPIKHIETGNLANPNIFSGTLPGSETAFGNIVFGLKHQFHHKKWVLAGQIDVEFNTANTYNNDTGIRVSYDATTITPLFLAGRSFGKTYLQTHIGFQYRSNNYSSNFKVGGEIGRKITKSIWLVGFLDVVKSFENGTIDFPLVNDQTGLYVNNQEYGAYGLKGIGEFTNNFGVTASFGSAFFGNNVPKKAAINFGIYRKF